MDQHLYKFLMLNGRLSLPGLGSVYTEPQTAGWDETGQMLHAPYAKILFAADAAQEADPALVSCISHETGDDEMVVSEAYRNYCRSLQHTVAAVGAAEIASVGRLHRDAAGTITFEPAVDINYLLPSVQVSSTVVAEEGTGKDLWWFYALILLILGLGALAYYYLS